MAEQLNTGSANVISVKFTDNYFESDRKWLMSSHQYEYPDEDFCLFANSPNERFVVAVLDAPNSTECTSTVNFLVRFYSIYINNYSSIFTNEALEIMLSCKEENNSYFDLKKKSCHAFQVSTAKELEYYSYKFTTEFLTSLVIFILTPLACFVGFILNTMIIRCVYKHRKCDLDEEFYKY